MTKMLPPTLVLLCFLLMIGLHLLWPLALLFPVPINLLGLIPLAAGLFLNISMSQLFTRVGTNIKTFNEPDKLVTQGWFKYSRNPMYLGFVLMLVGVWILLADLSPLLGVVLFVVVAERWYIPFEEQRMLAKFGSEYTAYRNKTRRWI